MEHPYQGERYAGNAAENYQRYFVPVIGQPVAAGLIEAAELQPGERVLDVACGTGVVTRMAYDAAGSDGSVTGLDANPGMIAVARSSTPDEMRVDWVESPAENMPVEDESFDAVLCSMGLQFFGDRAAGLREMHRVLADGGRAVLTLPGPIPPVFQVFERALARHVSPDVAQFAAAVFSLHEADEIGALVRGSGFDNLQIESAVGSLEVPPPEEFLWQYIQSTPLAEPVATADAERRAALEREVCEGWQDFVKDGRLVLDVRMTTVRATG